MSLAFLRTSKIFSNLIQKVSIYPTKLAKFLERDRPEELITISLAVLFLFISTISWVYYSRKRRFNPKNSSDVATLKTRKALEALLVVLAPTQSRWPSTYISIAKTATTSSNSSLPLPVSELIQDLNNGKLEVRNPKTLHELFEAAPLRTYGWTIRLHIDTAWRMDVISSLIQKRQTTLNWYQVKSQDQTIPSCSILIPY